MDILEVRFWKKLRLLSEIPQYQHFGMEEL